MPLNDAYAKLKAPATLALLFVAIITASYIAPYFSTAPETSRKKRDLVILSSDGEIYQRSIAPDLNQFRRENITFFPHPQDYGQAASVLFETEILWSELQDFMHDPEFRRIRFADGTRYGDWKKRADCLNRNLPATEVVGPDVHKLPGWLIAVANDYAGSPYRLERTSEIELWFVEHHLPSAHEAVNSNRHSHQGE